MHARHSIRDLFSTFLQFNADRAERWAVDARLRRSIDRCMQQASLVNASDRLSDSFWALYWHKMWQTSEPIAREHLAAYVQEPCYWAAQKTATGFGGTQYSVADCFQLAIVQFEKVLKGFSAQHGSSLKTYASVTFRSLIREGLRQRQEIDICTDWALLRKLSQKRLVEALQNAGVPAASVRTYVMVWMCFKTLYVPQQSSGTRQLNRPDEATWVAIGQLYRSQQSGLDEFTEAVALEKVLLTCAKAARAYLYPSAVSLNAPKVGQEAGEFQDDLTDDRHASLLTELIAEEETNTRQQQQAQLGEVLNTAILMLDEVSQNLLQIYYQDGLTQQQMADRLQIKQYTVSRRLAKIKEHLLMALAKWSQETLHITPTPDVLKATSTVLEEWLQTRYSPLGPASISAPSSP